MIDRRANGNRGAYGTLDNGSGGEAGNGGGGELSAPRPLRLGSEIDR